jgi:hypothetical protein
MVATATMVEGSMDILSCVMFMQLAEISLPPAVIHSFFDLQPGSYCFNTDERSRHIFLPT